MSAPIVVAPASVHSSVGRCACRWSILANAAIACRRETASTMTSELNSRVACCWHPSEMPHRRVNVCLSEKLGRTHQRGPTTPYDPYSPCLPAQRLRIPLARLRGTTDAFSYDRSEERRVGKEGRYRWSPYHLKKKKQKTQNGGLLFCATEVTFVCRFTLRNL